MSSVRPKSEATASTSLRSERPARARASGQGDSMYGLAPACDSSSAKRSEWGSGERRSTPTSWKESPRSSRRATRARTSSRASRASPGAEMRSRAFGSGTSGPPVGPTGERSNPSDSNQRSVGAAYLKLRSSS